MAAQLPLPFLPAQRLTREAFVEAEGNAQALAFLDRWPDWPMPVAAIYGPPGCGKSHLASAWLDRTGGKRLEAAGLAAIGGIPEHGAAIEDVDRAAPELARDQALFALIEQASAAAPLLLTGRAPPQQWAVCLPDLASRFGALLAFPLWAPDEALIAALARKLFADRQLTVPDAVVQRMLHALERSPAAIRDFVARADAKALAENRPVNLALVRELLAGADGQAPE